MSSIPYSRYLIYPVPWYSFLIVAGAFLAIILCCREERRSGLPRDTFIDLALWMLPFGIIGARLYYVIFSWPQFSSDILSVFRIWEGGIAIYGGVIAGLIVLMIFARRRRLSALRLCDVIAPGLALAQSIGRWGNWFNIEAYGAKVTNNSICFFPLAVQVPADGNAWHLATFFYESVWDFAVFLFLILSRRRMLRRKGDVFFFYLLLYAAGRLVIEELRSDSLYASTSIRVSQLLSVCICIAVLALYTYRAWREKSISGVSVFLLLPLSLIGSALALVYSLSDSFLAGWTVFQIALFLSACSSAMILCLVALRRHSQSQEVHDADVCG